MKLMLGNTPVKKMMIHNDTQDATMVPSDLQAGVTCYAKGQKIIGTGKCFEFATYGKMRTNLSMPIPTGINVIQIASTQYPTLMTVAVDKTKNLDFTTSQLIGNVSIDGNNIPINVLISGRMIKLECSNNIFLEVFYGKDNYI